MSAPPKVSFACPIPWAEMKGSDVSRYCAACGHTIHNLSALASEERAKLLQRAQTEKICGAYLVRLSGELVTTEAPLSSLEVRGIRQVGLAALSAGALALAAGCVSQSSEKKAGAEKPKEPIESVAKPGEKDEVLQLVGFILPTEEENSQTRPADKK